MNRRLINQAAFLMAQDELAGKLGSGLGEEELRQIFERRFETCRRGLEADRLREEKKKHNNLRPLEERNHVRSKAV